MAPCQVWFNDGRGQPVVGLKGGSAHVNEGLSTGRSSPRGGCAGCMGPRLTLAWGHLREIYHSLTVWLRICQRYRSAPAHCCRCRRTAQPRHGPRRHLLGRWRLPRSQGQARFPADLRTWPFPQAPLQVVRPLLPRRRARAQVPGSSRLYLAVVPRAQIRTFGGLIRDSLHCSWHSPCSIPVWGSGFSRLPWAAVTRRIPCSPHLGHHQLLKNYLRSWSPYHRGIPQYPPAATVGFWIRIELSGSG